MALYRWKSQSLFELLCPKPGHESAGRHKNRPEPYRASLINADGFRQLSFILQPAS
jgi:hypothetical protein